MGVTLRGSDRGKVFVVVSYDIPDDRRRGRVLKVLKDFGLHVQYSVFECHLTQEAYVRLRDRLRELYDPEAGDSIRFYFLCERDVKRVERLGGPEPWPEVLVL